MKKKFSVAILISTYNWPEALDLSVRSVWGQTILPDEIIIADDGSTEVTTLLIKRLASESPVPIKHIWQEDLGFRLTVIRNKALAASSCEYVLQIDGDVILEHHFVEDHLSIAKPGYYVCGSRVLLTEKQTSEFFAKYSESKGPLKINSGIGGSLNSLRVGWLKHILKSIYGRRKDHIRGCNFAAWLSDFKKINGYNEDVEGWSHEDAELVFRLINLGVRKFYLKFGGVVYHLHHKSGSKDKDDECFKIMQKTLDEAVTWCNNGMDKYLEK